MGHVPRPRPFTTLKHGYLMIVAWALTVVTKAIAEAMMLTMTLLLHLRYWLERNQIVLLGSNFDASTCTTICSTLINI